MANRTVHQFMTTPVVFFEADAPLEQVLRIMRDRQISCVVICHQQNPVGIFTERDVVGLALNLISGKEKRKTAGEVMSSELTVINAGDSIEEVVKLAQRKKIRHFPVVGPNGRLAGLLTQTDLIRAQSAG